MPKRICRLLLLSCLWHMVLFSSGPAAAQQINIVNVTGKLGLPATECYNVFQDRKGYLWVATEAGLCRYNGSNIQIFDKRNGLPERGVYAHVEDRNGTLWLVTSENRILMYKDGRLIEAPFSKNYQKTFPKFLTYGIREYGKNMLALQSYRYTHIADLTDQSLRKLRENAKLNQLYLEERNDQLIALNFDCLPGLISKINNLEILLRNGRKTDTLKAALAPPCNRAFRLLTCKAGANLFCTHGDRLIRIAPDRQVSLTQQKNTIISLYTDKSDGLWVGLKEGGVNYYPGNGSGTCITLLNGFSVSGVCEDREGNVWLSTLEKGLWVCKNKRLVSFAAIKGLGRPANMLRNIDGTVLASTDHLGIKALSGFAERSCKVSFNPTYIVDDILSLGGNRMLVLKGTPVFTDKHFRELYRPRLLEPFAASEGKLVEADSSKYYMLGYLKLYQITPAGVRFLFPLHAKAVDICQAGKDSMLLGLRKGLFTFQPGHTALYKIPGIDKAVTRIFKASDGTIWITTKEEGLYQFISGRLKPLSRELGLKTDIFFDIAEDRYRNIWLGSNSGLIRLAGPASKYAIKYFNTTNGIPANEVLKLATDSQYVYLSTVEGISRLPLSDTGQSCPPPIYLNAFKVNGKELPKDSGARTFAYNKNNFEFSFDVLAFDLESRAGLWYRINQDSFVAQKGNVLKLSNLQRGDYRLEVYGLTANGLRSKRPVILSFSVAPPFWKTWWFVLVISLLTGGLIYIWQEKRTEMIRRKAEEKSRMGKLISSYKLLALQAQMNPHFIFNSMNSIQAFILEQKEQDAYQYLSKFSRLIRNVLDHSDKLSIPLDQEISTLKTYIELEQYRFENKFSYELYIAPDIHAPEVSLPPMLVQPYVENAIWHGLLNLPQGSKGKLWLSFLREDHLLKILVRDNGIGRVKAAAKKKQTHTPVAMALTAKRLQIVHQLWGDATIKISITDLYDEDQAASGTLVELYLPLNIQPPEDL